MTEPAPDLSAGGIWQAVLGEFRRDFWTFFAIAAPFTVLVDMAMAQFGPPQPKTVAEITPRVALIVVLLPALIGVIAQLAVARLTAVPDEPPRVALAVALRRLPLFLAAVLLIAWPTGIIGGMVFAIPALRWAVALLVIPGLYVAARCYPMVGAAAAESIGPAAILRRSWALTAGRGWAIAWIMLLSILLLFGASLIAAGVGGALASVLTLAGLQPVGVFVANLANALLACVFSIGSAIAATQIYQRLRLVIKE
jgi:hypothetical protein